MELKSGGRRIGRNLCVSYGVGSAADSQGTAFGACGLLLLVMWGVGAAAPAVAAESDRDSQVEIADPFIELHTGPGRGYPIFYVEERGATITVLKRKTDWFKVRTARNIEGWVDRTQLERTLNPGGKPMRLRDITLAEFFQRRWELGVLGGEFGGANAISAYGAFAFTSGMQGALSLTHVLGDFSDSVLVDVALVAEPYPDWRAAPYFAIGTGVIDSHPHAALVQATDRSDRTSYVAIGMRAYVSRRFMVRAEYRNYVIFTSRDDNEEIKEWKAGFAVFF
jgi:hypothetical protein